MITFQLPTGLSATEFGIYFHEKLLAPVALKSVKKILYQKEAYDKPLVSFDCVFIFTARKDEAEASGFLTANPTLLETRLIYETASPSGCLKQLLSLCNLTSKKRPDKQVLVSVFTAIFQYLDSDSAIPTEYVYERSGWHKTHDHWIYVTSEYGIRADGLFQHGHCPLANAHLFYDSSLPTDKAFQLLVHQIRLDFPASAPLIAMTTLSLLSPLKEWLPYPSPGLLLSGPPQSGKTMYALLFGHLLTSNSANTSSPFLLQAGLKELTAKVHGLADTTFLLDDVRHSPSNGVNERIHQVLDAFVRKSFLEGKALPIVTGETDALSSMPDSWKSRIIEVPFHTTDLQVRRKIIRYLKENPLIVRTCFLHFIRFIAAALESETLVPLTREIENDFQKYMPRLTGDGRCYDNLLLLYWSFKIFLKFGASCHAITDDSAKLLLEDFIDVLKNLALLQTQHSAKAQAGRFLATLVKHMTIHVAKECDHCYRRDRHAYFVTPYPVSYGDSLCIDYSHGYTGVLLLDSRYIMGYPSGLPKRSLLVLSKEDFTRIFKMLYEDLKRCGMPVPYHNLSEFLNHARAEQLLLVTPRHEIENPHKNNLTYSYPCYKENAFHEIPTYIFEMNSELVNLILESIPTRSSNGNLDSSISSPRNALDSEICADQLETWGRRLSALTYD